MVNLDSIKKEKAPLNEENATHNTSLLIQIDKTSNELAIKTNLASDTNTKPMKPTNETISAENKPLANLKLDEVDCTKRKKNELTEEQLSNQINTPSSSYSSCSSTYSIKSPTAQKRQRTKVANLELPSNSGNSSSVTVSTVGKLDMSILNPQATTPLTPPPSVTQENSLGFSSMVENKFADAFGRSASNVEAKVDITLDMSDKAKCAGVPVNGLKGGLEVRGKVDVDMNNVDEMIESEDEDGEFPKTLEELLTKQWSLGAELIAEQSQSFDVMDFLTLMNDCKRENEVLEKKLSDLEKKHCNLLKLNEKLHESLNKPVSENSKPNPDTVQPLANPKQQQQSSFQPISTPQSSATVATAQNAQLVLPKTPVKQSTNSLLISASPISSASSPNNSSLQNISFVTNSPASAQKNSQQSSVIKNNTINNTSINNNINLISQADSCFYSLSAANKMNVLKNVNLNYPGMGQQQNSRNHGGAESMTNSMDLASQYQLPSQHGHAQHAHGHNQNHHLASALSELTKAQNESPSKQVNNKKQATNTHIQSLHESIQHQKQMQHQQQQQQHLQQTLFNMNPYQQQIYYAYLMQQQQTGGSVSANTNPNMMDPSMLIPGLGANSGPTTSTMSSNLNNTSNTNNNSNSSKAMSSISKSIIESTLSNIISKS